MALSLGFPMRVEDVDALLNAPSERQNFTLRVMRDINTIARDSQQDSP